MTEVAIRPTNDLAALAEDPTGGRLIAWAQAAVAAHSLATSLCKTSFVPKAFQGNANDATAAILLGDELGFTPLAALRAIYTISGTPALYAKAKVALTLHHGHQVWTVEDTPNKVVVHGRRKGSEHIETSTWDIARARKAGYTSNKKYDSDPQAMLYARASSDVCNRIAADVLAGVPYTVEELELADDQEQAPAAAAKPTRVQRAKPAAPVEAEPEFDPPADPESAPVDVTHGEELITPQQMKKMQAVFSEKGFKDSADRHDYVATLGFEVQSSNELTKAQAHAVIESLLELDAA